MNTQKAELQKVRVDKWLWSARFFKTRGLAKAAIEGGKVHFNGKRVKVSKEVSVGMLLGIRQGNGFAYNEKQVLITALSVQRGSATDANLLYKETDESTQRRTEYAEQHKLANLARPDHKPNKKERRKLKDFQTGHFNSDDMGL